MLVAIHITHPHVPGWQFEQRHAHQLEQAIPGLQTRICQSEDEIVDALPDAEVAMVWRFRQEWLAHAPKLRLLVTPAAGRDYFTVDFPPTIQLAYGRFHGDIMGETVVGMLLAMCRGILPAADRQRTELWPRAELAQGMGRLHGAHVLILGFGHIGERTAELLKPFGVRITGVRRTPCPPPSFFGSGDQILGLEQLDAILPTVNHLVLCLPGTPETEGMIDARRLALLPPSATLCNVGRGNAIVESALLAALHARQLSGACLDVFRTEPLPMDSPLRTCANLWLMPHASAIAPDYLDLFIEEFAQRWHGGEFDVTKA
jgi:phosphoglycerate dehydrogenase-like enzyme